MSVVEFGQSKNCWDFEVLSNVVASQIDLHKKWGGVYPELASRAHLEAMVPVLGEALEPLTTSSKFQTLNSNEIINSKSQKNIIRDSSFIIKNFVDAAAVTAGPGLVGSLLMGIETAQILGAYYHKSIIPVNHLEGHIYSAFCAVSEKLPVSADGQAEVGKVKSENDNLKFEIPKSGIFPILALVVSGGHTSLILMKDHLKYETVGQTIDDAAGEAFDKVARILGLGYPGGPAIEKFAVGGNENAYKLPIARLENKLNFSFSGLKTAVLYLTKDPATGNIRKYNKKDLAASFQKTACQTLIEKTILAIEKYNPKTVILSGGVSANSYLREHFVKQLSAIPPTPRLRRVGSRQQSVKILIPPKNLSTDNAVGIGIAGAIKAFRCNPKLDISVQPNWKIDELQ